MVGACGAAIKEITNAADAVYSFKRFQGLVELMYQAL